MVWAADVHLKASGATPGVTPVALHTRRAVSPTPGSFQVSQAPRVLAQPVIRRISMPTSLSPQEVHPTVPPAHAACNVMLPGRPPATPIVAVRAMAEPFLPQAAPAPAAPSRAEVAPTALACKNPSLTILIRDFEMQTPQLPGDWQSDLGCLAQCGRHITEVLSELAQQKRILVPLPGGASVPVSLLGREGPPVQAWYQVYAGHQELLAEALQMREDVVRSFFRQSSCASNQLTWRLGEVWMAHRWVCGNMMKYVGISKARNTGALLLLQGPMDLYNPLRTLGSNPEGFFRTVPISV
ncbi:unnamed protein product [Durusdinium trenchii]|uniref:Uncharacterized protein n=1 Tax=Durusdinium trenchii TaxID=1381693 RepID=A0ABP0SHC1_9DINO